MSWSRAAGPLRRAAAGAVAGVLPGVILAATVGPIWVGLALGVVLGALYGVGFRIAEASLLDHGLTGAALAVPAWVLVQVTALPLAYTGSPAWTLDGVLAFVPALFGWVVAGVLLGISAPLVALLVGVEAAPRPGEEERPDPESRVVIVGGGFGGLAAARRLEALFGPDPSVELVLVSETNATLFTPLLPEVAGGSLEPTHVSTPLRTSLRRTRVVHASVTDVEFDQRRVVLREPHRPAAAVPTGATPDGGVETDTSAGTTADRPTETSPDRPALDDWAGATAGVEDEVVDVLKYDHLVLAAGSVPDYRGMDDVRREAFDFKTLADAIRLRNHVVECFERADRTRSTAEREALVTFVVAGAGFAGAELAGALNDFARGVAVYYPDVRPEEVDVVSVHGGERILPELPATLAEYAQARLRDRGVAFELETRVTGADPGAVALSSGDTIRTETLVWTAGNRPAPLVDALDAPTVDGGGIAVDRTLSVPGLPGVWAVGDCAAATDPETGEPHPATAQIATREARTVADNVHAAVTGDGTIRPFTYRTRGSLAVIGHQVAVAEIGDRRFSGLFAWLLWRAVYLRKLPGFDRKVRVLVDWTIELFFPRELVQTFGSGPGGGERDE